MALPVVKQGEDPNAWLQRAVPTLVQQHQLTTEVATRLARQAWATVNGAQDLVAEMTGENTPTFQDQDSWGDNVVASDVWPEATDAASSDAAWPDPADAANADPTQPPAADPGATTDPTASANADPNANPNATAAPPPVPPAATVADGVQVLLSTLQQVTALVEGLQGLTQIMGTMGQASQPAADEDPFASEPDADEEPTDEEATDEPPAFGDKPAGDKPAGDKPADKPAFGNKPNAQAKEQDPTKKKAPPFTKSFLALGDVPSTGYVIPVYQERARELPTDLVSTKAVADFVAANADLWKDNYLGGKVDATTGKVMFGIFRHAPTVQKATQLCAALGVDTYYDLQTGVPQTLPLKSAEAWVKSVGFTGPALVKHLGDYRDPGRLAVKSLSTERFGGYLCLWGNKTSKDLGGEFFTPQTQELTAIFESLGHLPAIYHHAGDDTIKSAVIGLIDTMEQDEAGLWVEAQAQIAKAYREYVRPLIDRTALGWSSGALPRARQVDAKSGEILRWPIIEGSLTPAPYEWRMAVDWPVERIAKAYDLAGLPTDLLREQK